MSYIGNTPAENYASFLTETFSVSATANYTLSHAVANENDIRLVINGVVQQPGSGKAYTASGTTLTLTSATSSGDVMYAVYLGRALQTVNPPNASVGTAQLADSSVTSAKLASGVGGVAGITSSADATAMTITSAEKIGIGETVPLGQLHVKSGDSGVSSPDITDLVIESSSSGGISLLGATDGQVEIAFGDSGDANIGRIAYNHNSNFLATVVNASEVMRIDSSGNLMIAKDTTSDTQTGSQFTTNGGLVNVLNSSGYNIINRQSGGGTFIYFKQVNSTDGSISVSGATVSYNSFTGSHWSRLSDNSKPTILKGTVMETLDEMVDWYNLEFNDSDGNPQKISHLLTAGQSNGDIVTYNHKGTDVQATIIKEEDIKHCQTKISTTSEAKNVYGVFHCWDFGDDDGVNDMQVAAVGTYVVRIKSGETVTKGDLLQSNGDGTAKIQSDDNVKSSSFAKVLSNTKIETYDDGSFIVPCSLNC